MMVAHDKYDPSTQTTELTISQTVTIRKLVKADLPKLEWYGQYTHYRRLFKRSFQEQQLGKRYLLVADVSEFPIGRLFIQFYGGNGSVMANGDTRGYLYSFHVMEMFRGCGIGSRLIDIAETILLRRQFRMATIAVAKDNHRALRLYQRRGYTIFDENEGRWRFTDHQGKIHEQNEPCYLLEKDLKSL